MGKISEFLAGIKVLEETESSMNGKITVIRSVAFGSYIQVGGLTQSGGIIKGIWNTTLRKVSPHFAEAMRGKKSLKVLVLGLGGGSIVEVIKKHFPGSKIMAVDIDPVMVEMGKKHLGLNKKEIEIVIDDAEFFLKSQVSNLKSYNLICVDLYVGDQFPTKFETDIFLKCIRNILKPGSVVVFNRLYYGEKRSQAVKFGNRLEKIFDKVDVVYPEANIMFICKKT